MFVTFGTQVAQNLGGSAVSLIGTHTARPVDQRQLVGVQIKLRQRSTGLRAGRGGLEQFQLGS